MPLPAAAQPLLLAILLALCCFAPGFFFVRRLRLGPMEKLTASIALSLILIYLVTWVTYAVTFPLSNGRLIQRSVCFAFSGLSALLAIAARRDIARLFRSRRVTLSLAAFAALFLWTIVVLAMIRNYSGLGWASDWLEHFQRALFFLDHLPLDTPGIAPVPARPPLMNVLCAFFLTQTGSEFALFQLASSFLNLLPFLACALITPALGLARRARVLPLAALFAFSPLVMENATYPWTKMLTAFFVIASLSFYVAGLRKQNSLRLHAAFLFASAGFLTHYSAGPYLVFLALHYSVAVLKRRPRRARELASLVLLNGAFLATWFVWSISIYGPHTTVASNTSILSAESYQGNNAIKIALNIFDSIVPWPLRDWSLRDFFHQGSALGELRDAAFAVYQINLIFAMGSIGGLLILYLLLRRFFFRDHTRPTAEHRFWTFAIPFCVFCGLAVVGERDRFGTAHLALIPLQLLGIALLASALAGRRALAVLAIAGCIADFSFGVLLQARIEALENSPVRLVYPIALDPTTFRFTRTPETPGTLSPFTAPNWLGKHRYSLASQALAQLSALSPRTLAEHPDYREASSQLFLDLQQDRTTFGGWFARHQYRLQYLGDLVATRLQVGPNFLSVVLIFGFLSIGASVVIQSCRTGSVSAERSHSARAG